jgi:uncharacterized protein YlxW (UPF0749 family)
MYEKIKEICQTIMYHIKYCGASTIVICGVVVAFIMLFAGCKTTKTTINDKSEIKDSKNVKVELWQDSTLTTQSTEKTLETSEKEVTTEDTTITFGNGGGTYNTNTGEATNVTSIKTSKETEKLKNEVNTLQDKYQQSQNTIQSLMDSIAKIDRQMDLESEIEETYQVSWYWWLIIGALLMLIAIVVLRKIPATSWLLFWI